MPQMMRLTPGKVSYAISRFRTVEERKRFSSRKDARVVSLIASTASDGRVGSGCHQTCLQQTNGSWNNSVELQCRRGYLQSYHTKTVRITDLNLHVVHSIRNQVAIMQEVYRSVRQRQQYQTVHAPPPLNEGRWRGTITGIQTKNTSKRRRRH